VARQIRRLASRMTPIGKAKQGIGSAVGSDRLQTEGAAQEIKGDAQKVAGRRRMQSRNRRRSPTRSQEPLIFLLLNRTGRLS
jgi:uncharacterized protein YjbJ (UPF0337 family)